MFWSKSKPAAPPVITSYSASTLEKGKHTDRRSSFSSGDSSPQSAPIKSLPESLPQQPKAAYTTPGAHSQTESVEEHTSAGLQSFSVLSTQPNRVAPTEFRRLMRRYWFIFALAILATITIIAAISVVMFKTKRGEPVISYSSEQSELSPSSYWIIVSGSIVHNPHDLTTPIPTPTPTPAPTAS